jgi:aspartyl protease family protein
MKGDVPGYRLTGEVLLWASAVLVAYATFHAFEPLYEKARAYALQSGWENATLFPKPQAPMSARKSLAANKADIRGTLAPVDMAQQAKAKAAKRVTFTANGYNHFHAQTLVNGKDVEFLIDTGATYVALSYETAVGIGINPNALKFNGRSTTANGVARVASVTLDMVRIEGISMKDVQAVVAEPGKMSQNLLGMSFIGRLSGFELSGQKLVMIE